MKLNRIAIVGFVSACALAVWTSRPKVDNSFRQFIIHSTLLRNEHPIVILGDSIVEASTLPPTICGRAVVNAGIGGTQVSDRIESVVIPPRPESRAALVLVALGTNDAGRSVTPARFKEDYRSLIAKLKPHADRVALLGIPSPEAGFESQHNISAALVGEYNGVLPSLAAETRSDFIAMPPMPPQHTVDGVHLSGSGYAVWDAAVTEGIAKLFCPAGAASNS